ncbi:MAG: LytR/AlgR family response regulator transcription factor [Bacteroidota bacterium]
MKKIRCIVVDDEQLAAEVIEEYIKRLDTLELVKICHNATEAFSVISREKIDLMFLDIKMPGISGTQFIKSLSKAPAVIFTTAYAEYAVEGFDLQAIDYLVKPVPFPRFIKAVNKLFSSIDSVPDSELKVPAQKKPGQEEKFVFVKTGTQMTKVFLKDILYVEARGNSVIIFRKDNDELTTYNTISKIEARLPEDTFIRIHRSFIVAIPCISSYNHGSLKVKDQIIPIGRSYKKHVMEVLESKSIE